MAGFTGATRVFARAYTWVTDKANSVKITASRFDEENDKFKDALNELAQYQRDGTITHYANTGGADALTATVLPAPTAYTTGMWVRIKSSSANTTTTPTLNLNSLGAKTITRQDGTALNIGDISADGIHTYSYDGTNFQLLDPVAPNIGSLGTATSATGTDFIAVYSSGSGTKRDSLNNVFGGRQTIWVPAGAMYAPDTNGAAAASTELASNDQQISYLAFDPTTDEKAQFDVGMPSSWDEGTMTAQFMWTHATATSFVSRWGVHAVAFASGDAIDAAFGTAVLVETTGGTTDELYISSETSAFTVAGTPGEDEWLKFEVYRDADATADTLNIDARLLGVRLYYTTNAINDD